jgi:acyl-CoA thioesterase I
MKKIIILIICVSIIGGAYYFMTKKDTIKNYPALGDTIVVFGDSLVYGVGSTQGEDFVSVLENISGEGIVNLGVSGDTTADGLKRIDGVLKENPKVVMVLLGGNDFLRKVPIETTFENLDAIVTRLDEYGAVVIILGVQGGLLTDPYKDRFEKLAKDHQSLYVPNVLGGLIGNNTYMSDSVHPNDAGYAKIATKILPVLKKALGKD